MSAEFSELFIVAGEESANQYALKLMKSLKQDETNKKIKFSGVGFKSLKDEGFELVFDASKLSVMGAFEVLNKWKTVKDAFDRCLEHIRKNKPKAVLLIDFGGFNLRLARKIKEEGLDTKVLYFISPKFWAWGSKRALKVKKYVDQMYVIHPFEVDFYKKWGVEAVFVGHPLLEELQPQYLDQNWKRQERIIESMDPDRLTLGVLLGSRPSELAKHKEPFCKSVELLVAEHTELQVVFIAPPSHEEEAYAEFLGPLPFDYQVLHDTEPMRKMAVCDFALVASGTATLQLGLLGIPMVIGYFMNPVTMFLAKIFVRGVKHAGLVNIIAQKEIAKEFLQNKFNPKSVSAELSKLVTDKKWYAKKQIELLNLQQQLGEEKTYERLASEIRNLV